MLLLDEPGSTLDPLYQHSILQMELWFAAQGGVMLVIVHDLNLAARYCDGLLRLDKDGGFSSDRQSTCCMRGVVEDVWFRGIGAKIILSASSR